MVTAAWDADVYSPKTWLENALLSTEARKGFSRIVAQGWTDAVRELYPAERIYTFWDYRRNRWPRDAGLRIDRLLISKSLKKRLSAAGVDRAVRGLPEPSDHAPAWIELR